MSENVGSIGIVGEPYFDRYNNRIKGFCPYILRNDQLEELYSLPFLVRAMQLRNETNATRVTLRFIFERGQEIQSHPTNLHGQDTIGVEAIIPFTWDNKDYLLLYWGANHPNRLTSRQLLRRYDELIKSCINKNSSQNYISRVEELGYCVGTQVWERDIPQILEVYKRSFPRYTFDLTSETISSFIENPNTIISVVRNPEEKIVSVAIAETALIPTNRGNLCIAELSDEATIPEERGKGLMSANLQLLLQRLQSKKIPVIYEEARACNIGANKSGINVGLVYGGRLNQHCIIGGHKDLPAPEPYEDLNVLYLPSEDVK